MVEKKMFSGASSLIFQRAAKLRSNQTFAEEILWQYLRTKPMGFKFRRQHAFSTYILDFYCHRLSLVIEVDGSIHNLPEVKNNDAIRQKRLEDQGLTFIRFTNEQIIKGLAEVIRAIENYIK